MNNDKIAKQIDNGGKVQTLSVIIGTAFQRSIFRISNLFLMGLVAVAMLFMPSTLLLPVVICACFLIGGNTFLGATDQSMLSDLVDEFSAELSSSLEFSQLAENPTKARAAAVNSSAKSKLKGKHRELFQKLVKSRKELNGYLTGHNVNIPGVTVQELNVRLDSLTESFRSLAGRGSTLADFLLHHPHKSFIKEAENLEKKSEEVSTKHARDDYKKAAAGKRMYAEKLSGISVKVEDIDAKLHHIISTIEGYTVMMATSGSQMSDKEIVSKIEEAVGSLKAETEAVDEVMKLLDS